MFGSLQAHMRELEALVEDNIQDMGSAEVESARQELSGIHSDLEGIQSRVGFLVGVGRLLRWVPTYGEDLYAAPDLMEAAIGVSSAAERALLALTPAWTMPSPSVPKANRRMVKTPSRANINTRLLADLSLNVLPPFWGHCPS